MEKARSLGRAVEHGNLLDLRPNDFSSVEYVTFDNVLEHPPSLDDVERALSIACETASRLVYIRHPSCEDEEYLASFGLKQ